MTDDMAYILIRATGDRYIYEFSPEIEELFRRGVLRRSAFDDRVSDRSAEAVCGDAEAYVRERTGMDVVVMLVD